MYLHTFLHTVDLKSTHAIGERRDLEVKGRRSPFPLLQMEQA